MKFSNREILQVQDGFYTSKSEEKQNKMEDCKVIYQVKEKQASFNKPWQILQRWQTTDNSGNQY